MYIIESFVSYFTFDFNIENWNNDYNKYKKSIIETFTKLSECYKVCIILFLKFTQLERVITVGGKVYVKEESSSSFHSIYKSNKICLHKNIFKLL